MTSRSASRAADRTVLRKKGWELLPHRADTGVRGFGPDKDTAFEQAATALTAVITDPQWGTPRLAVEITCEAPDLELFLVDWLNTLVYEMATRRMLFSRFAVRIEDRPLSGRALPARWPSCRRSFASRDESALGREVR